MLSCVMYFCQYLLQCIRPFHPAVIVSKVSIVEQNIYDRSGFSVLDEETSATVTTEKPV